MENEEFKGKQQKMKELNDEPQQKVEVLGFTEKLNEALLVKERHNNDALQDLTDFTSEEETDISESKMEYKFNEKAMPLHRILEEEDRLQHIFAEETRKMQRQAREHVQKILEEQEKLNNELELMEKELDSWSKGLHKREAITEKERQKLDNWSKELNKREAVTEKERQKLDNWSKELNKHEAVTEKERQKLDNWSKELNKREAVTEEERQKLDEERKKASMEQVKVDKNVFRLVEEQKRAKEEVLSKIVQLKKQLDAELELEMEIQKKMKEMNDELQQKAEDLDAANDMIQVLMVKERQSNAELQEARKVLIHAMTSKLGRRTRIGIKRMGEIDQKAFHNAFKEKFPPDEAMLQATTLCSLWQANLKDSQWHPFKVITAEGGRFEQILDEKDEKLRNLKQQWGEEIYNAVVAALKELEEYNPSGRSVTSELWDFKEQRKATLEEVIEYVVKVGERVKRRRT